MSRRRRDPMAIQPIDLQTLFSQVDKIVKTQSAQLEGLAAQQAMQGVQLQRKTDAHIQEVNEAQDSGDGAEKVNDRNRRKGGKGDSNQRFKSDETEEAENEKQKPAFFSDPSLGKNIDISL